MNLLNPIFPNLDRKVLDGHCASSQLTGSKCPFLDLAGHGYSLLFKSQPFFEIHLQLVHCKHHMENLNNFFGKKWYDSMQGKCILIETNLSLIEKSLNKIFTQKIKKKRIKKTSKFRDNRQISFEEISSIIENEKLTLKSFSEMLPEYKSDIHNLLTASGQKSEKDITNYHSKIFRISPYNASGQSLNLVHQSFEKAVLSALISTKNICEVLSVSDNVITIEETFFNKNNDDELGKYLLTNIARHAVHANIYRKEDLHATCHKE